MKIKYTEKYVSLGKKTYKIIIPHETEGFVNGPYILDADRKAFQALAFSMMELIQHKDTIIHFQLWNNAPAEIMYFWKRDENRSENFDVVFFSHALQFKIKDWKMLRNKAKKVKGNVKTVDLDLNWATAKTTKLNSKFSKTDIYHKEKDRFIYRFAFDTHFFIGGVQSFTEFYLDIVEFLGKNLEHKYKATPFVDWMYLPQEFYRPYDTNYRGAMEIGFWDRRYEKAHEDAIEKSLRRYSTK